jgi:hypothetical protein
VKDYGLDGQLQVEVQVVDKLEPENGDKFKRVVSKVDGAPDKQAKKDAQAKVREATSRRDKAPAR